MQCGEDSSLSSLLQEPSRSRHTQRSRSPKKSSKVPAHSRDLEARVANAPMLVGASRKAFIGAICNQQEPTQRDWGTTATCCSAIAGGAAMVRVHNVAAMRQVVDVMDAIRMA